MNALIHRKYGKELWEEAFRFSIHLRKKLLKNLRFIRPFLPPIVHGRKWEEADDKEIMNDPAFFSISKDYAWHGFSHAEDGLSMIDPCKILLTSGSLKEYKEGIPAPLISMYLESKGITREKSDFCTILFLAEPGDKEGKAKRLVSALADLEKAFEENRPVSEILPECSSLPEEDIRDLSSRFFHFLHEKNVFSLLNTLFSSEHFPDAPMTGRKANQLWLSGKGEKCPLAEAEGRTALEAVLPYPPASAFWRPEKHGQRTSFPTSSSSRNTAGNSPPSCLKSSVFTSRMESLMYGYYPKTGDEYPWIFP